MKSLNLFFLSFVLISLFDLPAFSQTQDTISLNTIITKTEKAANKFPQEKVYLHFDKPYYALGDTIWFKSYLTAGIHTPSQLSKIVYIDILSGRDSLIQTLKLPVSNSVSWGNLALTPGIYRQGDYQIRAYTRWMVNFDADYHFSKIISVGNGENLVNTHINFQNTGSGTTARILYKNPSGIVYANKKITWRIEDGDKEIKGKGSTDQNGVFIVPIPENLSANLNEQLLSTAIDINDKPVTNNFSLESAKSKIDLQFFPEGGDLISELPIKVAFKAVKQDGFGINIKGTISDNEGHVVVDFNSQHLGMGLFVLVPEFGKTYTAKITSPLSYSGTYALPTVKQNGITLTVSNSSNAENLNLRFLCNTEFISLNKNKTFYLLAKVGETIYYAAKINLLQQAFTTTIPKDKFPSGIVQLTLFSANGQPLSERITFIRQPDDLNLALKTDKTTYSRRQKVKLSIGATNNKLPVEANLSVSVIDESKVPFDENAETTILTNLLLTSDLKGYIEKPNYYFNRPTEKTAADLDVLMLTQGYRRFLYSNIIADKNPPIYFLPEQGIDITGILRNSTGMPLNKANVKLRIPDKYYTAYAVTNGSGVFKFPNIVVTDSSHVIVTSADYSNKNPMLTIDPTAIQPAIGSFRWPKNLNIDSSLNKYLQNNKELLKRSLILKEVVIKSTAKVNVASHLDYPALSGLSAWPDHMITKDRFKSCPNFFTCMRSMLTGVIFENENFYVNRDYNAGNKTPMQIFFNGMPVDVNYLNGINSMEIESVEIFLKDQLGLVNRTYNSNGVLVINSIKAEKKPKMKLEDIRNLLPKSGEVKFIPQGYTVSREFYSPKYTAGSAIQGTDLRTTIYWDPKLKTDKTTGTSQVEFYNADGRGTYRVIVEGFDAEGHIGRSVYRYKVE
ncbi:carboxypeptidase-like regulatory domain-containing protein [Pedobacter sp. P351]|uniref:carboxypeptidase-like regulatory domain-containing protein n=1 Tax=Pedobacter superstes TaxID=3133441 RepID=UPI0030AA3505